MNKHYDYMKGFQQVDARVVFVTKFAMAQLSGFWFILQEQSNDRARVLP